MAQYWIDQLHCLGRPGERIADGYLSDDAGFLASAPWIRYYSDRGSTAVSALILPLPALQSVADADVHLRWRFVKDGMDNFPNTGCGLYFRWADVSNNFYLSCASKASSTSSGGLYKTVYGSQTQLGSAIAQPAAVLFSWFNLRVKLTGSAYQYAFWLDGFTPPSLSSAISVDVEYAPTTGGIGLRGRSYGSMYDIASIAIGTNDDTPPTSASGCANVSVLSGTVTDHDDSPCAREVRVFLRSTGALIGYTTSDAVTGAWSVPTQFTGLAHDVVVQDDATAPSLCDLIASNIVP